MTITAYSKKENNYLSLLNDNTTEEIQLRRVQRYFNTVLVNTEQVEPDLANIIADEVYRNFENPNIRDLIKIGRIARNRNDVLLIVKRLETK